MGNTASIRFSDLSQITSSKRKELLKTIHERDLDSISELADILDRNYSIVHRDIKNLEKLGLVKIDHNGNKSSPKINCEMVNILTFNISDLFKDNTHSNPKRFIENSEVVDYADMGLLWFLVDNRIPCLFLGLPSKERSGLLDACKYFIGSKESYSLIEPDYVSKTRSVSNNIRCKTIVEALAKSPDFIINRCMKEKDIKEYIQALFNGYTVYQEVNSKTYNNFKGRCVEDYDINEEDLRSIKILYEVGDDLKIKANIYGKGSSIGEKYEIEPMLVDECQRGDIDKIEFIDICYINNGKQKSKKDLISSIRSRKQIIENMESNISDKNFYEEIKQKTSNQKLKR